MKHLISIFCLCFLSISFAQKKIDQTEFKKLMTKENAVVLDVRTPEEFSEGHITKAININYFSNAFLKTTEQKINKNKVLLVYCAAGGRSGQASKELKKAGYKYVYDLIGGYDNWKE